MRKVVFLDRDGVINKEIGDYVYTPEAFEFTNSIFEFLRALESKGFEFIVITNQGGIEKGRYTEEMVFSLMDGMVKQLNEKNIEILDYYFSPHHSNLSNSLDRKPDSLMLEKGIARYNVDVAQSYMIGDNERDIEAGEKVGLKSILISSNQNLMEILDRIA